MIVEPFEPAGSDVRVPAGAYGFTDVYLSYWMGAQRRYSGSLSFQHGGFFNGEITALGYSWGRVEITPRLSVEPGVSVNRIDLPAGCVHGDAGDEPGDLHVHAAHVPRGAAAVHSRALEPSAPTSASGGSTRRGASSSSSTPISGTPWPEASRGSRTAPLIVKINRLFRL